MSLWNRIERRLSELADELLPDDFREDLAAARIMVTEGRADAAMQILETLIAQRPDHVGALSLMGAARLELDDPMGARRMFEDALRMRPDAAAASLGLGQASVIMGDLDRAQDAFRDAMRSAGGDRSVLALAYRGLGITHRQRGELDKAIRELRKAMAENSDDLLVRAALGEALLADPGISAEEARFHLELAVRGAQRGERGAGRRHHQGRDVALALVLASLALGRLALTDEDDELARLHFTRALELLDGNPPAADADADADAATDNDADIAESDSETNSTHADADIAEARIDAEPVTDADVVAPDSDAVSDSGTSTADDIAGPGSAVATSPPPPRARRIDDRSPYLRAALLGLGDAALLGEEVEQAHAHYAAALELFPHDAELRARIGDAQRRRGDHAAALRSYQHALAIQQDPAVLGHALETAIIAVDVDCAVRLANDMLAIDPGDGRAAVARGMGLAQQGQLDAARATFRAAAESGAAIEAHLALGVLELEHAPGGAHDRAGAGRAATEALAALRIAPTHARARALLRRARAQELLPHSAESELADEAASVYRLADDVRRLALARSELAELAAGAARAAADFDQPLLVTVMGEFSSGKSTFVNAFIGADVAPTGITPTTATINIVRYGRERGGRINYRDGSIDTVAWDDLGPTLRALDDERARAIDTVEILFPLPQLQRVNIVDTPGLNSILPEHEEVARGFIARADAVIWVFTANQAGKASERSALESIRQEGKRVLGVLNKKDQLRTAEVDTLVEYVQDELGELVECVVPVAARVALERRRQSDEAETGRTDEVAHADGKPADSAAPREDAASTVKANATSDTETTSTADADADADANADNWTTLESALETRFFTQARQLKRSALERRLLEIVDRARAIVAPTRTRALEAATTLRAESDALLDAGASFIDRVVLAERAALQEATQELYRQAAREVLELVRPRQLPFGSNSATPADRAYLVSLLDSGFESALERSRRQVLQALETHRASALHAIAAAAGVLGVDALSDVSRTGEDALRLVAAQVFDATRAFLRGYVRGGYVSRFFTRDLPRLELAEENAYDALIRDSPDLDAEIALRLANGGTRAISALASRLAHWADVAEVQAYDVEVGIGRALDDFWQRLPRGAANRDTGPAGVDTGNDDDAQAQQSDDAGPHAPHPGD
ncbi:dynamin family protein [Haliangium ochraceum]|uniref:Dynamin family protein n=1 Tax=Haliangium ochraceum (strain DSM 14365 / JCM 11303 / SMP-2) TaxID=502025 RepID=D0LVM5_HALO1|nr:dynamin family protein [Haliangium ochraceum]ACY19343.1 Dynamin family protein [Haliangium ochraceum DSM 14365]